MSLRSVLLLTTYRVVHFTDELGMSCPWRQNDSTALFSALSIPALKDGLSAQLG